MNTSTLSTACVIRDLPEHVRVAEQTATTVALRAMDEASPPSTARQRVLDVRKVATLVVRASTRALATFKGGNCYQANRLACARDVANDILAEVKDGKASVEHGSRLASTCTKVMEEALGFCGNGATYMNAIDALRSAQDDGGRIARGRALREPAKEDSK